ncbi:MAG: RsmE family RNA methyltransferase [Candidatus Binataceae bacterium]
MNRVPRFVVGASALNGDRARVSGTELHHMRDVMRLKAGDRISLLVANGSEFDGQLIAYETACALVEIHSREKSRRRARLILAAATIKGPRMDFMVEKAAELGADELWPLLCARGVARNPGSERRARWDRLALAATKQSLRADAMIVAQPCDVGTMTARLPSCTLALMCMAGARPIAAIVRAARPSAILITCGPEGDFDFAEQAAMRAAGFVPAGLGINRLRSETAALAALGQISGALHELDKEN